MQFQSDAKADDIRKADAGIWFLLESKDAVAREQAGFSQFFAGHTLSIHVGRECFREGVREML